MRVVLIGLVLLLAACGAAEAERPRRTTKERQEAAEVLLQRAPVPRVYRYAEGELRVLEVPVKDATGGFVDLQRCFLWRDTEFRSATVSCSYERDVLLPSAGRE